MRKRHIVTLTRAERERLMELISSGEARARKLTRARILLKADAGDEGPGWTDEAIRDALDVGSATIARVRKRFVENGLDDALNRRKPRRQYQRKLNGEQEAHLIALACGQPPEGYERWSLRLLADRFVELEYVDSVSHECVRKVLKKTNLSLG
jgi:transposase